MGLEEEAGIVQFSPSVAAADRQMVSVIMSWRCLAEACRRGLMLMTTQNVMLGNSSAHHPSCDFLPRKEEFFLELKK